MRPPILIVALAAMLLVAGGCVSWIAVRPAPDEEVPGHRPDCTQSNAPAVVDTVLAVAYGALTVAGAAVLVRCIDAGDCDYALGHPAVILAAIGLPVAFVSTGAFAAYGYRTASSCREARARPVGISLFDWITRAYRARDCRFEVGDWDLTARVREGHQRLHIEASFDYDRALATWRCNPSQSTVRGATQGRTACEILEQTCVF